MTLPYNVNIPFATNDPSVDQPDMEENTNTINTFVQQDHLGFNNQFNGNANSGGWHTDIHLINQGAGFDPARITQVGQLFAKEVTFNGITDVALFYRTGTNVGLANSLTQMTTPKNTLAASSGYTFLPGGIIMQWGSVTGITSNQYTRGTVLFPVPYPTNIFQVIVSPIIVTDTTQSLATIAVAAAPSPPSLTQFVYVLNKDTLGTYKAFSWIAIGN